MKKIAIFTVLFVSALTFSGCQTEVQSEVKSEVPVVVTPTPDKPVAVTEPLTEQAVAVEPVVVVEPVLKVALNLQTGYKDTVRYTRDISNRVWVEMKDQAPSETGRREISQVYEVAREVKSVDADGSMQVALTFNEVTMTNVVTSTNSKKTNEYISKSGSTQSTWENEPTLSGVTIMTKMLQNGAIEFVDLVAVREKLKLTDEKDDNHVTSGLISEKMLKFVLQRPFQVNCPNSNFLAKSWDVFSESPDAMLNAKALRMIYTPAGQSDNKMTIKTAVEPLYILPEGVSEPGGQLNIMTALLRDKSDLQEPVVESEAVLDMSNGLVLKDKLDVSYLMILDGNKLFPDQGNSNRNADAGMMYIEIKLSENYEIVK